MQLEAVCPNAFTFSSLLKACGNTGETENGRLVHATVSFTMLFERNLFVATAVIGMYAKWGHFIDAEAAFSRLSLRDEVVWTSLVSGYVEHGHGMEAVKCLEQMHHDRISPSATTYTCILGACILLGDLEMGRYMHCEIIKRNLLRRDFVLGNAVIDMYSKCGCLAEAKAVFDCLGTHNVVSWTALISGYTDHELAEDACACYLKMQNEGISPDAFAVSCCLKACGTIGAAGQGEAIYADITSTWFSDKDLIVGTALVDMYAKCGLIDKAQDVFNKLPIRDKVLWNSLLTGYSQYGEIKKLLLLFDRMRKDQFEPHSATFVNIFNACTHAGLIEEGHAYFDAMRKEFGIHPLIEHYTCMMDLYGRAGMLEEAVVVLNSFPCHPNMVTLMSILGACRKLNNLEVGQQVFYQALGLCMQEPSVYVSLYNLYAGDI
ncbi:hypothetical protein KP509_36G058400 [Ceratopteris richardii]|nr:hypothetical protein KP509_36G058400 [Ceratopteris richardii]